MDTDPDSQTDRSKQADLVEPQQASQVNWRRRRKVQEDFESEEQPTAEDNEVFSAMADKWKLVSRIGSGGMSTVYHAMHLVMRRDVAIKMLLPHLSSNNKSVMRFQHEANAAGKLNHPNLVRIYDCASTENGRVYLIMEYLRGKSLAQLIREEGELDPVRATGIFVQICQGLTHAHEHGIIHRDLKPSNIMVSKNNDGFDIVKLVDFGIAKLYGMDSNEYQALTQTGEMIGSPLYMSPEQCSGKTLDIRSDIYSLGCLIYETLTGMPPLVGSNPMDTIHKHMVERPKSILVDREKNVLLQRLDPIVRRCLEKEPEDRYSNTVELLKELEHAALDSDNSLLAVLKQVQRLRPKLSRRAQIGLLITALTLCLTGTALFLLGKHEFREHSFYFNHPLWQIYTPVEPKSATEDFESEKNDIVHGLNENNIAAVHINNTARAHAEEKFAELYYRHNKFSEALGAIQQIYARENAAAESFPIRTKTKFDTMAGQCCFWKHDWDGAVRYSRMAVSDVREIGQQLANQNEPQNEFQIFASENGVLCDQSLHTLVYLDEKAKRWADAKNDCQMIEWELCAERFNKNDPLASAASRSEDLKLPPYLVPAYAYPWSRKGWSINREQIVGARAGQADMLRLILDNNQLDQALAAADDTKAGLKEQVQEYTDAVVAHYQLAYIYQLVASGELQPGDNPNYVQVKQSYPIYLFRLHAKPRLTSWSEYFKIGKRLTSPSELEQATKITLGVALAYENAHQYEQAAEFLKEARSTAFKLDADSSERSNLLNAIINEQVWVSWNTGQWLKALTLSLNRNTAGS